jgi:hypothetical protein
MVTNRKENKVIKQAGNKGKTINIILISTIIILVLLLIAVMIGVPMKSAKNKAGSPQTGPSVHYAEEKFITQWMMNDNHTLKTYLKDAPSQDPGTAAGFQALSESMGLWMSYLVEVHNPVLFQQAYDSFTSNFMDPQAPGFVYWIINKDGTKSVSTNALIDDLRVAEAMKTAGTLFNHREYIHTAEEIVNFVGDHNVKNGIFVDYYDKKTGDTADSLTLSYIMPLAFKDLYTGTSKEEAYTNTLAVLQSAPVKGYFFPKSYNGKTKTYHYDENINMIDQAYTALNRNDIGASSDAFYQFIKNEMNTKGKVFGEYNLSSGKATVTDESPALYGLLILYTTNKGDQSLAQKLYNRMKAFQQLDIKSPYYGGYLKGNMTDTHEFDNLFPLLAEVKINHKN